MLTTIDYRKLRTRLEVFRNRRRIGATQLRPDLRPWEVPYPLWVRVLRMLTDRVAASIQRAADTGGLPDVAAENLGDSLAFEPTPRTLFDLAFDLHRKQTIGCAGARSAWRVMSARARDKRTRDEYSVDAALYGLALAIADDGRGYGKGGA